jgi:hypothetical protein
MMKNLLRLEEAGILAACLYALYAMNASWWWYPLLVLGPDISMLGYAGGNRTGAAFYNLFHHKGVAVAAGMIGFLLPSETLLFTGIVLMGHSSMDRMFGYGLKTDQGFKFTHLGTIGKRTI